MLRNLGGAALGYVVMAAVVFLTMTLAWIVLGAEGAFRPGAWEISAIWTAVALVTGILAAIGGGWTAARVGQDGGAVWILVALTIVLGAWSAIGSGDGEAGARAADIAMTDAMMNARQPAWLAWGNVVIGVVGVLLGARLAKPKRSPREPGSSPAPGA